MDTSLLIARIAAVAYISSGIALLNGKLPLQKTYEAMKENPLFLIMMGMMTLLLGMLIINTHNVWVKDWQVLITLIGWILTIEGVLYITAPELLLNLFTKLPQSQIGWGLFTIAFGILFGYFGFIG